METLDDEKRRLANTVVELLTLRDVAGVTITVMYCDGTYKTYCADPIPVTDGATPE